MSLYSLYSILFLTFIAVYVIGFLFVSCCKDIQYLQYAICFHYFLKIHNTLLRIW